MKDYELLIQLGNIFNCIEDNYLKALLLALFEALKDNQVNKLDLETLNLFDYSYTRYEYHNIKACIEILEEYFNINKYADIINIIRVSNGLGYDNSYLMKLYNELDKKAFNTLRLQGLLNLLSDKNLVYNNIGLRIIILKYLQGVNISKYSFYKLDNYRLGDNYKFLTYKNGKIKFYSKLFFVNGYIIISTLEHDNITNYILLHENDNINNFYGGNNLIEADNQFIDNLKDYQYRYKDKEAAMLNKAKYLYYIVNRILNADNYSYYLDYNSYTVDMDNIGEYIRFFNKHYIGIIQTTDKMFNLYHDIINILEDIDLFYSNDINKKSIKQEEQEDYFKYEIKLSDYFLRP